MEFLSLNNVALNSSGVAAPLNLDSSGNLKVNVETGGSGGSSSSVTLLAGSATIGSISNTSFGLNSSIPAGSNSIGTVVLGAGANTIGAISNSTFAISSLPSIPAGSNSIGNLGTVSTLTSLSQLNGNNIQYTTMYAVDRINWANSIRLRIV